LSKELHAKQTVIPGPTAASTATARRMRLPTRQAGSGAGPWGQPAQTGSGAKLRLTTPAEIPLHLPQQLLWQTCTRRQTRTARRTRLRRRPFPAKLLRREHPVEIPRAKRKTNTKRSCLKASTRFPTIPPSLSKKFTARWISPKFGTACCARRTKKSGSALSKSSPACFTRMARCRMAISKSSSICPGPKEIEGNKNVKEINEVKEETT